MITVFYILFLSPFAWFIFVDLNLTPIKILFHQYYFRKSTFKKKPEVWLNKSLNTPEFDHWSLVIRFLFWYFGIQINYKGHNEKINRRIKYVTIYRRIDNYLGCFIDYWIPMEPKTNLIGPFVHNHRFCIDYIKKRNLTNLKIT